MVTFGRFGTAGVDRLAEWLATFNPEIVAFDEGQTDAAFAAFKTYGKGIHPKAKLNFGDCASYALAKTRGLPLLCKGGDFAATDILTAASFLMAANCWVVGKPLVTEAAARSERP